MINSVSNRGMMNYYQWIIQDYMRSLVKYTSNFKRTYSQTLVTQIQVNDYIKSYIYHL